MKPLISFIIPVFNSEKYVDEAIDSVLNCGYDQFEIVLVDDGSDDSSPETCSKRAESNENINFFQHNNAENKGVSYTRKVGVDMAKGEYIYFLDSDDILLPGIITKYLNFFDEEKSIVLVHGEIETINTPEGIHDLSRDFIISGKDKKYMLADEPYFLKSNRICTSTCMIRKQALSGLDFTYDQVFPMAEDWLMFTLLSEKGLFYYHSKPVIRYRVRSDSATMKSHRKGEKYLKYNLMEFYLALFSKSENPAIKNQIKIHIESLLNELSGHYTPDKKNKDDIEVFAQGDKVNSLNKRIYNLERGYGYYFYFIYLIRKFIITIFRRKGA